MMCVMRKDIYDKMDASIHPLKHFLVLFVVLEMLLRKVYGYANLPYVIDGITYKALTVVTDTGPSVLLGLNFLVEHKAVINYETGKLALNGHDYTLSTKHESKPRRMANINNVTIAAKSESTIELKPVRRNSRLAPEVVISPLRDFARRTGLVLGHTLSSPVQARHVLATVVNPSDHPVSITAGTHMGLSFPVQSVTENIDSHSSATTVIDNTPTPIPCGRHGPTNILD